jgi:hypothetical protein
MAKISYEDMKMKYKEWLSNPIGLQSEIFKKYGWSRLSFFDEASNRGEDI